MGSKGGGGRVMSSDIDTKRLPSYVCMYVCVCVCVCANASPFCTFGLWAPLLQIEARLCSILYFVSLWQAFIIFCYIVLNHLSYVLLRLQFPEDTNIKVNVKMVSYLVLCHPMRIHAKEIIIRCLFREAEGKRKLG